MLHAHHLCESLRTSGAHLWRDQTLAPTPRSACSALAPDRCILKLRRFRVEGAFRVSQARHTVLQLILRLSADRCFSMLSPVVLTAAAVKIFTSEEKRLMMWRLKVYSGFLDLAAGCGSAPLRGASWRAFPPLLSPSWLRSLIRHGRFISILSTPGSEGLVVRLSEASLHLPSRGVPISLEGPSRW
jgi:hypothetical protein